MTDSGYLHSIRDFENLDIYANQVVEGFITGLHQSPYHGFSVEFSEHRLYNPGESTRHIDWKLYARTDKLFVKRFEEETNLRCQIILDTSGSMYFPYRESSDLRLPNKMEFSVFATASLMNLLRRQRDAVGISAINQDIEWHTPARTSRAHHHLLLGKLEEILQRKREDFRPTALAAQLHLLAERLHRRSMVLLFTDLLDKTEAEENELFSALQHFRHNLHEVILFHVEDASLEGKLEFEGRPIKFIDLESGESIRLHPESVRERYIEDRNEALRRLKLRCGQYGIEWVEADIRKGYVQVLLPYLLKRKKLF